MKNLIAILSILCTISLISCDKNKSVIPSSGMASASINGVNWVANSVNGSKMSDTDLVFGFTIQNLDENNEPYPVEQFFFRILKNKFFQKLKKDINSLPTSKFFTFIDHGCASNEEFEILSSDTVNNWVQITEEVGDFKEIKGKFSLTLIKTDRGIDANRYPDTLRIRNGVFSVVLD